MENVFTDRKVLVADDEPDIIEYVAGVLRSMSPTMSVTGVGDGLAAMRSIRQTVFDLVILDLKMPDMNGYAVLSEIRMDERTRLTPVLILTGYSGADVEADVLDTGADGFVSKPISRMVLLAQAHSLLRIKSNYDGLNARIRQLEKQLSDLRLERGD